MEVEFLFVAIPAASSPDWLISSTQSPSLQEPRVSWEAGEGLGKFLHASPPPKHLHQPASRSCLQGSAKTSLGRLQPQAALPVLRLLGNLEGCL